ncbi:MAG: AMP-binding protein [Galbitalea sp.]
MPARPAVLLRALRDALSGSGPAVLVSDGRPAVPDSVPNRVALVVETSGSTARPKRVALSADALLASAAASALAIGGHGQWLLALPTHYIAGLNVLVRSLAGETEPVVLAEGPFDPVAFARAAETLETDLRFVSVVPAQLARLLDEPAALPALRRFDPHPRRRPVDAATPARARGRARRRAHAHIRVERDLRRLRLRRRADRKHPGANRRQRGRAVGRGARRGLSRRRGTHRGELRRERRHPLVSHG